MSSNLKVNTILPSTGTTIGIGTVGGLINVVGNIDVNSTSGISTFNGLEISGIVTAKAGAAVTYYGDGSNLTGITDNVVTINNNANNRVITGSGSANTLEGEANLQWDGETLYINRSSNSVEGLSISNSNNSQGSAAAQLNLSGGDNSYSNIRLECNSTSHHIRQDGSGNLKFLNNTTERLRIDSSGRLLVNTTSVGSKGAASPLQIQTSNTAASSITIKNRSSNNDYSFIYFTDDDASEDLVQIGVTRTAANTGDIAFYTNGGSSASDEKFRIKGDGDVSITDGDLIMATAGHGIDFSATGGVTSGGNSELFDDYEEGSFTATLSASGGGASFASGHIQTACLYVKIGSLVHVQGYFSGTNVTNAGSGIVKVSGLPFTSNNTTYYTICLTHNTMTSQTCTGAYVQYANTWFYPILTNATNGSSFNVGNPRYLMFGGSYPVQY